MSGRIKAICISDKKGIPKKSIPSAELIHEHGIAGDAHAGPGKRQVSILSDDSIEKVKKKGIDIKYGDFAENIVVGGMDLTGLKVKHRLIVNGNAVLEVTQIGKKCRHRCRIFETVGECSMSDKGIFAGVIKGGVISVGDRVECEIND